MNRTASMTRINEKTVAFFMPLTLHKRGGHKMIIVPAGRNDEESEQEGWNDRAEINTNLLKALVRATLWQRQLKGGKYTTLKELTKAEKVTRKYVQLILRLNFLAPDIKEAILEGKQPQQLKLIDMRGEIPLLWEEQREAFEFKN